MTEKEFEERLDMARPHDTGSGYMTPTVGNIFSMLTLQAELLFKIYQRLGKPDEKTKPK